MQEQNKSVCTLIKTREDVLESPHPRILKLYSPTRTDGGAMQIKVHIEKGVREPRHSGDIPARMAPAPLYARVSLMHLSPFYFMQHIPLKYIITIINIITRGTTTGPNDANT